jgi:putative ABC transport system substrate-binding protein
MLCCMLMITSPTSVLRAAPPPNPTKVGVLNSQGAPSSIEDGLREGLKELGYVEGKNILIEWRRAASSEKEMPRQAADLARLDLDLIISMGTPATRAALDAGAKAVVFWVGDPVAAGFAVSLSKPGGNATGVSVLSTELNRKRLEFLRAVAPRAKVVGYLTNASSPLMAHDLAEAKNAAHMLGLQLIPFSAQNSHDLAAVSQELKRRGADALVVVADLGLLAHRVEVARLIREAKIPAILPWKEYHDEGVLMSYAPDNRAAMRLLAIYVDKIVKGSKPAELPVEQISRYELVIDLRVAREMGTQVPSELLLRADEVIR